MVFISCLTKAADPGNVSYSLVGVCLFPLPEFSNTQYVQRKLIHFNFGINNIGCSFFTYGQCKLNGIDLNGKNVLRQPTTSAKRDRIISGTTTSL